MTYNRPVYSVTLLIAAIWLLSLGISRVVAADAVLKVTFDKYSDGTPVTDFAEPYMTFTTSGLGMARAWQKALQLYGGLSDVSITLSAPASQISFDYDIAGSCASKFLILLFRGSDIVSTTSHGHCEGRGTFNKTASFDRVQVTLGGVQNSAENFHLDNLQITIQNPPASNTGPTIAPTVAAPTVPTLTPLPEATEVSSGAATLINDLGGKSLVILTSPDDKAKPITTFPSGTFARVTRGPQEGQGVTWWRVRIYGLEGWILTSLKLNGKDTQTLVPYTTAAVEQNVADITRSLAGKPNAALLNVRGLAYYNLSRYDEALADFNQALKLNPKSAQTLLNIALVHVAQNGDASAINDLTQAIKLSPKDAALYDFRGANYLETNNMSAAAQDFSRAIALNPDFASAYANLGVSQLGLGSYSAALDYLAEATRIDPFYGKAFLVQALIHIDVGDLNSAKDEVDRALDADPKLSDGYAYRGLLASLRGDYVAAMADLNQAIQLNAKSGWALVWRGDVYRLQHQGDLAIVDYQQAVAIKGAGNTCQACAYNGLGDVYSEQGKIDLAIENYTKAIAANPSFVKAYVGRSKAYQAKGDQKAAQGDQERARQLGWNGD